MNRGGDNGYVFEAGEKQDPASEPLPGDVRRLAPWPAPLRGDLPASLAREPLQPMTRDQQEEALSQWRRERRAASENGEALNRVVYDSQHYVPLRRELVPGGALLFESRFESGNLRRATHIFGGEYDLALNWDHNTRGHTQWYFFAVQGAEPGVSYRFNIVNFCKPHSLYRQGMQPLVYSAKKAELHGVGWERTGTDVLYYENGMQRRDRERSGSQSTLSFRWSPALDGDTLYFAMCYPYTYSDLRAHLHSLEANAARSLHIRRKRLVTSDAGNDCDLLWLTNFASGADAIASRPVVALSARVHPGESNSSWMMHGILDFLTGPTEEASALRNRLLFLIVPMLNPDGVIVGNYRCSLSAVDLNRRWARPLMRHHPTIAALKKLLVRTHALQPVRLYVDLHGHSRKHNVFMYGCAEKGEAVLQKVFPLLLARRAPHAFAFRACSYAVKKGKDCTARVVVHRELPLLFSYTLEASFCGASSTPNAPLQHVLDAMDEADGSATADRPCALRERGESLARRSDTSPQGGPAAAPATDTAPEKGIAASAQARSPSAAPAPPEAKAEPKAALVHFNTLDLQQIGVAFCRALLDYFSSQTPEETEEVSEPQRGSASTPETRRRAQAAESMPGFVFCTAIQKALQDLEQAGVLGDNGDSDGSDGNPSDDNLPAKERATRKASRARRSKSISGKKARGKQKRDKAPDRRSRRLSSADASGANRLARAGSERDMAAAAQSASATQGERVPMLTQKGLRASQKLASALDTSAGLRASARAQGIARSHAAHAASSSVETGLTREGSEMRKTIREIEEREGVRALGESSGGASVRESSLVAEEVEEDAASASDGYESSVESDKFDDEFEEESLFDLGGGARLGRRQSSDFFGTKSASFNGRGTARETAELDACASTCSLHAQKQPTSCSQMTALPPHGCKHTNAQVQVQSPTNTQANRHRNAAFTQADNLAHAQLYAQSASHLQAQPQAYEHALEPTEPRTQARALGHTSSHAHAHARTPHQPHQQAHQQAQTLTPSVSTSEDMDAALPPTRTRKAAAEPTLRTGLRSAAYTQRILRYAPPSVGESSSEEIIAQELAAAGLLGSIYGQDRDDLQSPRGLREGTHLSRLIGADGMAYASDSSVGVATSLIERVLSPCGGASDFGHATRDPHRGPSYWTSGHSTDAELNGSYSNRAREDDSLPTSFAQLRERFSPSPASYGCHEASGEPWRFAQGSPAAAEAGRLGGRYSSPLAYGMLTSPRASVPTAPQGRLQLAQMAAGGSYPPLLAPATRPQSKGPATASIQHIRAARADQRAGSPGFGAACASSGAAIGSGQSGGVGQNAYTVADYSPSRPRFALGGRARASTHVDGMAEPRASLVGTRNLQITQRADQQRICSRMTSWQNAAALVRAEGGDAQLPLRGRCHTGLGLGRST